MGTLPIPGRRRLTPELDAPPCPIPTLAGARARLAGLPPAAGGLLPREPLPGDVDLPARKEDCERVLESFRAWREGRGAGVAIVGPRGSGRTSLLNRLAILLRAEGAEVKRVPITERLCSEEAVDRSFPSLDPTGPVGGVAGQRPARAVLVDDLHNAALRVVGGGQGLEAILERVRDTQTRVFWVVTAPDQAWHLLERRFGLAFHFRRRLGTAFERPEALREILGPALEPLRPRFMDGTDAPAGSRQRAPRKTAKASQAELRDRFYAALLRETSGSLLAASVHLLCHLDWTEAERRPTVRVLRSPDLDFVRSLERPELFTLASLLHHGGLTVHEHAEVFLSTPRASERLLESLTDRGLVEEAVDAHARFGVNLAVEARLASMLHTLNVL